MTFAVIKTGGKQYKVAANDVVRIEKIAGEPGEVVTFDQVLMVGDGDAVTIGAPLVEGALVAGHFIGTRKSRTVIVLKKERRQHYDRRNGHRQRLSTVRITEILTGGKAPTIGPDEKLKARAARAAAVTVSEPVMPSARNTPSSVTTASETVQPAKGSRRSSSKKPETFEYSTGEGEPVDVRVEAPSAGTAPTFSTAPAVADDVKLIGGVGPALQKKLAAAGVTSLAQIAGWSADDIARVDAELDFKGRIEREDWVGQAKDLVAGKPPRAKSDQAAAAAAEKKPAPRKKAAPKTDKTTDEK